MLLMAQWALGPLLIVPYRIRESVSLIDLNLSSGIRRLDYSSRLFLLAIPVGGAPPVVSVCLSEGDMGMVGIEV